MKKQKLIVCILLLVTLISIGCKKSTSTNPTTPFQQVLLINKGIAQTNQDLEKAVEALNATVPPVIDTNTAASIITMEGKIAVVQKKLTTILEQGPDIASAQSAQIQSLCNELSADTTSLVNAGTIGIKNPDSQNKINAYVNSLNSLSGSLISGLKIAGVLK